MKQGNAILNDRDRWNCALEAMKALLAKDFKNIGYSSYSSSHRSAAEYIADQSFILADAMIERENKKESELNKLGGGQDDK